MLDGETHHANGGRAADEEAVRCHRHEHHVHVEGRQPPTRVESGDGRGQGLLLRGREGSRVREDPPQRHFVALLGGGF